MEEYKFRKIYIHRHQNNYIMDDWHVDTVYTMSWLVYSCICVVTAHVCRAAYGIVPAIAPAYMSTRVSMRDMTKKPHESNKIQMHTDVKSWLACLGHCPRNFECWAVAHNSKSLVCSEYNSPDGVVPLQEDEQAATVIVSSKPMDDSKYFIIWPCDFLFNKQQCVEQKLLQTYARARAQTHR